MTHTETVRVALPASADRSYEVVIGAGLLERAGAYLQPRFNRPGYTIVTDPDVAGHHLDRLRAPLEAAGIGTRVLMVPAGEQAKSWETVQRICTELLQAGVGRQDVLLALGGGVAGDLTGFCAAILKRGCAFVQLPTTLLAQVDSSVGGKTGINTGEGKNLIGAFHQPALVLADLTTLTTLPRRQLQAGYAEIVKYGLIRDAAFFDWLELHGPSLLDGDPEVQGKAVAASVRHKAEVVAADEREAGARALLNLGHTFGHALEALADYSGDLLHGEAVAVGMVLAFALSEEIGLCPPGRAARVAAHLGAAGLRTRLDQMPGGAPDPDALLDRMRHDKKVRDGRLVFVLAEEIGRAVLRDDIDPAQVRALLAKVRSGRAAAWAGTGAAPPQL